MPRLLQLMLRPYMAPEPGDDGSGVAPTEAPAAVLAETGLSAEEFASLPDNEREALLADTLDDTTPIEDENEAARLRAEAEAARASAAPPPPAPTPKPTAAPAATPAPTPAPEKKNPEDEADEAANRLKTATAPAAPAATPAPTAAPAATPAPTAAPASAWQAVDNVLALPEVNDPPPFKPALTADMTKQRTDAQKALDDLEEKYDDGDITKEEFTAQRAPLREQIRKVDVAEAADSARAADRQEAVVGRFNQWIQAGFEAAKKAGIDYLDPANADKVTELDEALVRFAKAAPLMHPGKPGAFYDQWALNEAHKEVAAKYGINFRAAAAAPGPTPAPPPAAKTPAAPAPTAKPGTRAAPDLSLLPPTLAKAPPAADTNLQVDEFAHLDVMTPAEAERAVARMTPEQQERYLAR